MFKIKSKQSLLPGVLALCCGCACLAGGARRAGAQEQQFDEYGHNVTALRNFEESRRDAKILNSFDNRENLTDRDLTELDATMAQMTAKWQMRDPKFSSEVLYSVCGILAWKDFHSSRQTTLTEKLFARSLKTPDQMPLEIVASLISTLAHMDERLKREQQPNIRKTRMGQWAYVFERMDKETDPNFNPKDAPMMNMVFFGDYTHDPVDIKADQERYQRNEEKRVYFNHQYWLQSKRYQYVNSALWHFKAAFTTPKDARELRDLLHDTNLKADFQTKILDAVNKNVQQNVARQNMTRK